MFFHFFCLRKDVEALPDVKLPSTVGICAAGSRVVVSGQHQVSSRPDLFLRPKQWLWEFATAFESVLKRWAWPPFFTLQSQFVEPRIQFWVDVVPWLSRSLPKRWVWQRHQLLSGGPAAGRWSKRLQNVWYVSFPKEFDTSERFKLARLFKNGLSIHISSYDTVYDRTWFTICVKLCVILHKNFTNYPKSIIKTRRPSTFARNMEAPPPGAQKKGG